MGCITSKQSYKHRKKPATFLLELNPRSFRVANVDDDGVEQNYGVLEVRDCDLLFHQSETLSILPVEPISHSGTSSNNSGQPPPIRWPLKSLRRYGFDGDLFSFESGRRCVTGPGIYAFRCARSELLFQLVQDSIVRLGREEEEQEIRRLIADQNGRMVSGGIGNNVDMFSRESERRSNRINSQNQAEVPVENNPEGHQYINKNVIPNYINTDFDPQRQQQQQPNYLNQPNDNNDIQNICNNNTHNAFNNPVDQSHPSIQYAQLDLPAMLHISRQNDGGFDEDDDNEENSNLGDGNDTGVRGDDDDDNNKASANGYINLPKINVFSRSKFLNNSATTNNTSLLSPNLNMVTIGNTTTNQISTTTTTNNTYLNVMLPSEKINYIQLDLKTTTTTANNSDSKFTSPTFTTSSTTTATSSTSTNLATPLSMLRNANEFFPTKPSTTDCYAVIDMERTQAISNKALLQNSKLYDHSRFKRFNSSNN